MSEVPRVRREILVGVDPATAFRVFTQSIGAWWPVERFSVHGASSEVSFRDGFIVESSEGAEDAVWGRVETWDPPAGLSFTWHPGAPATPASRVAVTFEQVSAARTLVRLEHSGWDAYPVAEIARAEYDQGWPVVLAALRRRVEVAECTWAVLMHSPVGASGSGVFTDPRFAAHMAFLSALSADGWLVAAGPLDDEPGAGMTIVRAPGPGGFDEVRRRATEDDGGVTSGLLKVTVRPWSVREIG